VLRCKNCVNISNTRDGEMGAFGASFKMNNEKNSKTIPIFAKSSYF
jgi:hypothetical protein